MPTYHPTNKSITSLKGIHVYGSYQSPTVRPVLFYLEMNRLPYTFHFVDDHKFEQFGADFTAINPEQLVPAIVDDGVAVGQTEDILLYLDNKYNSGEAKLYDQTADVNSIFLDEKPDDYLNFVLLISYSFKPMLSMFEKGLKARLENNLHNRNTELLNKYFSKTDGCSEEDNKAAVRLFVGYCENLNNILSHQPYLLGDRISIVDYYWAVRLKMWVPFLNDYPALEKWANEIFAVPELAHILKMPFMMKVMMFLAKGKFKAAHKELYEVVEQVRAESKATDQEPKYKKAA